MPARFEAVIFDWDGTLVDSTRGIAVCMQDACRELGLAVPSLEAAQHVIGLGLEDALEALVPELPREDYGTLVDAYRRHFVRRGSRPALFDGIAEMLDGLSARGHAIGIATGKSESGLRHGLESLGLSGRFDATRTADQTAPKPDPTMLRELMRELQVGAARVLMVGDTSFDLDMAARAGVSALAVTYGAHRETELQKWRALDYIRTPRELARWLERKA